MTGAAGRSAEPKTVAVVGAGSIGTAWAIVFARAGNAVRITDVSAERIAAVPREIDVRLGALTENGLLDEDLAAIGNRITVGTELAAAVAGVDYVQECVLESEDVKRALFGDLDALAPRDTVLASSSSMIAASRFAGVLAGRHRCLVVHPGNPPFLLPIAEVVPAPFTDPIVVDSTVAFLSECGMTPVRINAEVEGFVFNRLQGAVLREAYCLVRDGVISPTDLDSIVRLGLAPRWNVLGPFATSDLNTRGGLERHAVVMGPAYARMGAERGQDDPWTPELVARVAAELHQRQPLEAWADNVDHRDAALMRQLAARRAAGD